MPLVFDDLEKIERLAEQVSDYWMEGKDGGSIIDPHSEEKDEGCKEYYGGRVVCETVCGVEKEFIIQAPTNVKFLLELSKRMFWRIHELEGMCQVMREAMVARKLCTSKSETENENDSSGGKSNAPS